MNGMRLKSESRRYLDVLNGVEYNHEESCCFSVSSSIEVPAEKQTNGKHYSEFEDIHAI
jgi:hypothetical protein